MNAFFTYVRRQQLERLHADRPRTLDRALRTLGRQKPGGRIPGIALADAVYGWGNEGWSADEDYLRRVMSEAARPGHRVLECGSGLSTLLLASVARTLGAHIHSLEHNEDWRVRVVSQLNTLGLTQFSTVHFAPITHYGEYDWYAIPESLPRDITLVICDGPPSTVLGGRYGALPVLRDHLGPVCNFLMDDANRADEIAIMDRWTRQPGVVAERVNTRKGYARVTVTAPSPRAVA